jgi:hypothetical protein
MVTAIRDVNLTTVSVVTAIRDVNLTTERQWLLLEKFPEMYGT